MIFKKYGHIRTRLDEMMELDKFWKDGLVDMKLYDKFGKIDYYKEPEFGSLGSFRFIMIDSMDNYSKNIPLPKGKGKTIKFKRRLHPLGEGEIGHPLFDSQTQAQFQNKYCRE